MLIDSMTISESKKNFSKRSSFTRDMIRLVTGSLQLSLPPPLPKKKRTDEVEPRLSPKLAHPSANKKTLLYS